MVLVLHRTTIEKIKSSDTDTDVKTPICQSLPIFLFSFVNIASRCLQLFPPVRETYLLSVVSKYYVPYQSDGRIGLSAA